MTMPEWRRRLADRAPLGDHWRVRHHCTDGVVLGALRDVDKTDDTPQHDAVIPSGRVPTASHRAHPPARPVWSPTAADHADTTGEECPRHNE